MAAAVATSSPWNSANDPKEYVGCKIEIISNSDIRYSGTLYVYDQCASTVSLRDVRSFGTESRRPADQKVAPSEVTYEYIVFRVSDIKDLIICEPPASPQERRLKTVDSAIVSASDEPAAGSGSAGPTFRFAPGFMRAASGQTQSRRARAASEGNTAGGNGGAGRNGAGGNGGRGGRGGVRGAGRARGRGGRGGFGNGNGNGNMGRRGGQGASVFPYPNQNDSQDWLTRYQKDMNLKAEFQNVNPDLAALAKVMTGSQQLPPEKIRDIMEGNLQAFMTATEMPGKEGNTDVDKKQPMFAKDGFFDELTNPPQSQNEPFYNRSKDVETFGPAANNNNNNRGQQQGQRGGRNGQNNQGGNRQGGGGGGRQQNNWSGNNQGLQNGNRGNGQGGGGGSWNGGNNQGGGGSWNGGNNQGGGSWSGGNNRRGRGGNQGGSGGNVGRRVFANMMNRNNNNGSGGFTFNQRDLVIPAQSNDWTFTQSQQRAQTALWTPGLDIGGSQQQQSNGISWTFSCGPSGASDKPVENGYDVVTPSPSEEER